ncbi:hypothetical protein D3C71_770220 [compost metagenome]
MHTIPRLVINLCDRLPNGFISFGTYDMTMPAALTMAEGPFDGWISGYIPASTHVCMHVDHDARVAAWNGTLYSFDLPHMADPFLKSAARFGGPARLIEYLEAKYSARGVRRHAESLVAQIEGAEFVPASRIRWLAHPITGEVHPPGEAHREGDVPFAFAGLEAVWRGVDPRELYDFTRDRGGVPDAMEYLAASFSRPGEIIENIEELDDAMHALRHSQDARQFHRWIAEWNAKQNVRMKLKDERRAVGFGSMVDKQEALVWCRQYLDSAMDLEKAVDEHFTNPL